MKVTLYGISNCDTVKKARSWLDKSDIEFLFHDFRKDGLTSSQVQSWLDTIGSELLVNKRSTTWKQLDDKQRAEALGANAAEVITAHPTLIKRPVLAKGRELHIGFKPEQYASIFND